MQRLSAYLAKLTGWPRRWMLFAAGAVATFALAPFGLTPVMFIALPLLVMVMDGALSGKALRPRLRAGFGVGWWFGFGYFVFGLWWLGVAIWKDGAYWALPLAVLGFPAGLALFYGLAGALAASFWRPGPMRLIALGAAMVAAEWLRGHLATGFPWNAIAYTAMPTPLFMQAIRLTGLYVMGGFAVYVFASPALLAERSGRRIGVALALVFVAVDIGYGWHRLANVQPADGREVGLRLVQPAFEEADWRTEEGRDRVFATLLELSSDPAGYAGKSPDIIIWPESVLPFTIEARPDARTAIGEMLKPGQTLVFGAASFAGRKPDGWPEFYNAVYVLDDAGRTVSVSGKTHLVPFGEYLPFEDFFRAIGLDALTTLPGSYVPVDNRQMLLLPDGAALYPLICYEAVFPRLVEGQAAGASALVNVTYDAWFGRTPGPFQHFAQARLRAVEAGKPLIRVGENGVTAMVDPYGRIIDRLPFDRRGVLDGRVSLR